MPSSGLFGPYALNEVTIERVVDGVSPGAYALGTVGNGGSFYIKYIGRADADLKRRLLDHVGTESMFKYGFFRSVEEAFKKECELYHNFSPPRNKLHPAAPAGSKLVCPRCQPSLLGLLRA